ncbi:hypothetical protein [Xylophilus sp.]|uniref:hypothetical protein n=1 Tax=Xylophilus sp. TaxID=2653893 RepID=UPI0013BD4F96|nr:hypothetical protein [Xylophilus sp.]KAF1044755.1 MAG: hypothetical protein GAK38_03355 [Xylophilus sp.]
MAVYADCQHALALIEHAAQELDIYIRQLETEVNLEVLQTGTPIAHPDGRNYNVRAETPAYIKLANPRVIKDKHLEWNRKLQSVIMGYAREAETARKHVAKGRDIAFTDADVTVGNAFDPFAKAVQLKHTVAKDNAAVNDMIAKAANQLTGETGEKPG